MQPEALRQVFQEIQIGQRVPLLPAVQRNLHVSVIGELSLRAQIYEYKS